MHTQEQNVKHKQLIFLNCKIKAYIQSYKQNEKKKRYLKKSVIACAARSSESAQTFAKTHKIPKYYGNYDDLINDPSIDVIYIGTIHPTHKINVIKFC